MGQSIREADPGELRLPPSRSIGGAPPQSGWFPTREGTDVSTTEMRSEVFDEIRSLAEVVPEMRAGQLLAALGELSADLHGRGLWEASDAELLEALWQFRRDFEAATTTASHRQA